jgi:tetratricopeptide (TPR) repeat protein
MGNRVAAKQFYDAGEQAAQNNRGSSAGLTQAYGNYVAAAYVDPTWGQAHYAVGNNACDLNMHHAAVAAYRRALECENSAANLARIHCNLGWQLHVIGKTQEAYEHSQLSVELDPALAFGWLNLSIIHYIMNNTETAVSCALKANELLPDDPTAHIALAFAYMHNRQFAEGLRYFEARFRYKLHQYLSFPFTRWKGERDRTVFIAADQGLGDTLSFARFVPEAALRSKFVHLCVQPELMRLFEQAFGHIRNLNLMPLSTPFPAYDHWTTFVSLPTAMGLSNSEIVGKPHFKYSPPPMLQKHWKVTDRKFHIGIAWSGSALNDINAHRSIDLKYFLELQRVPGVQLYSLQKDAKKQDLYDTGASSVVRDLSGYISDVTDTLSIMKGLDLVIACESAVPHMAALAGKECWVPYSRQGKDFRIGIDGTKAIWTPKARYFLQGDDDAWGPVFDNMVGELNARLAKTGVQLERERDRVS